jgi:hypothetical protein
MPHPSPKVKPIIIANPEIDARIAVNAATRLAQTPPADLTEARQRITAKVDQALSALHSVKAAIGDPPK